MKNTLLYIIGVSLLCISCNTTTIDICSDEMPHRTDVKMFFDFGNVTDKPDSMTVFAVRNLNFLRYTYRLTAKGETTSPATGKLVYPDEMREHIEGGNNDYVRLHAGDYEMVAFSGGEDFYYDNLEAIMQAGAENVDSLWITHVSYPNTKSHPKMAADVNWVSHNIYTDFILCGDRLPTFVSRQNLNVPLHNHTPLTATFNTSNMSQKVTIQFTIDKDPGVIIDGIVAEISGIAHRIYLMTGQVDVSRTFKTLFHPQVLPASHQNLTSVTVSGDVYVNGLVHSANPAYTTGPGVMWVNVYAHTIDDDGNKVSKPITACINLYNLLKEHPSLRLNEHGEAVQTTNTLLLKIPAPALLNIEKKTLTSKGANGVDPWITLPFDDGNIGLDI